MNTLSDKELWCSDQDLIVAARYFAINILNYKEKTRTEAAHWVCYSPGTIANYRQKPNYPDLCIYFADAHYQTVTSLTRD